MYCVKQIDDCLFWVGGNDRRLNLFENLFPIPKGISYNSYILMDEYTVLFDTVDRSISNLFMENVEHVLAGRTLDYIVLNHMEPDHCASLTDLLVRYPHAKVIGNTKTFPIIRQFYDLDLEERTLLVAEGDTLVTGTHTLQFYMMPMVHWPEVMCTYDTVSKTLFSADAFGTFGSLNGHIFADEFDFEKDLLDETRRYYTNIVGKYGSQVQSVLKKAASLDIQMICSLHGPVWRQNLPRLLRLYQKWSTYEPEEAGVTIAYASIYGNTENAVNILACLLSDAGVKKISMYDVSVTDPSYIVSDAFRFSHLVFASSTYNNGVFSKMNFLLDDLKTHNLQNRAVAIIQNGTWSPSAGKLMTETCAAMKNMRILGAPVTIRSALTKEQVSELCSLSKTLADDILVLCNKS